MTLAVVSAGGAVYRYVSTRGIVNPLRAPEPALRVVPASGPVGMHPALEVDGFARGAVVTVSICRAGSATACARLGSGQAPGRVASAAIPPVLPGTAGDSPVEPGSYELRASADGVEPVVVGFEVVPFALGARPAARSYAGVAPSALALGAPVDVARGAPCSARALPDGRLFLGRSVFDPATAVAVDLAIDGAELVWAPDGSRLAIVTGDRKEIRVAAPDGSGAEVVTREARGVLSSVTWAPDADRIAFVASPQAGVRGGPARPTALTLDLTTGERSTIAPATAVSWSPDGSRLALEAAEGGRRVLRVVDAGGQGPTIGEGRGPAWSFDGALLAYVAGGEQGRVVVAKPGTQDDATVIPSGACGAGFSADGKRLIVVSRTGGSTQLSMRPIEAG